MTHIDLHSDVNLRNFIIILTKDAGDAYLSVAKFHRPSGSWFFDFHPAGDHDRIIDDIERHAPNHDVYVGIGLYRSAVHRGRGSAKDVCHLPVFSFDFDVKPGAATSIDDLPSFLEASPSVPHPTCVVRTGGGLLLLWQLDEPFAICSEEDTKTAQQASAAFGSLLRDNAMKKLGWKFDTTQDIVRLVRVPGTLNHKYEPARPTEVIQWAF